MNSGSSSSRPSGMVPYRPSASHSTKTTNPDAVSTNSHPVLSITQASALPDALASVSVLTKPHTRKPTAMAAVTPKTTQSTPAVAGECLVLDRHVEHRDAGIGVARSAMPALCRPAVASVVSCLRANCHGRSIRTLPASRRQSRRAQRTRYCAASSSSSSDSRSRQAARRRRSSRRGRR